MNYSSLFMIIVVFDLSENNWLRVDLQGSNYRQDCQLRCMIHCYTNNWQVQPTYSPPIQTLQALKHFQPEKRASP